MGNNFLSRTQKTQHLRETMNKWNLSNERASQNKNNNKKAVTGLKRHPKESLPATHVIRD
jgi:hypothetical protein